jgi:MFS family permease
MAATAAPAASVTAYAWYVVGVLTLCYTLSYIDRQILNVFVGPIRGEFQITDAQFGLLQGLGFAIFYTLMGLPLGRVVDHANRRNLIVFGIVVWSFFTAVCALAPSYNWLFIGRVGVGIGEATLGPAAFSILADYFPRQRLGLAANIFYVGNLAGASLALIIGGAVREAVAGTIGVPVLGEIAGWRFVFLLLGIPGMAFAMLVFTVREPVRSGVQRAADGHAHKPNVAESVAEILKRWRSIAGVSLAFACQAGANYGFMAWAVEHFLRAHQWQPGQTTRALGFLTISCGCAGLYLGGLICNRWQRRGIIDAGLRIAIPSAAGVLVFLSSAMLAATPGMALALAAPGLLMLALPMGAAGVSLQHIVPNQLRGQVTALYLFLLNIGGLPIGSYVPGYLTTNVFQDDQKLGLAVAVTIAVCASLMLILIASTRRPYRRDYESMHARAAL